MATVIRVSGTRVVTPKGDTTVSSPIGRIYIDSTDTYITGHLTVDGATFITDTTQSLSSLTGALTVLGGVGLAKNLNVGGNASITGTIAVAGSLDTMIIKPNDDNVGNPFGLPLAPDVYGEAEVGREAADLQRQQAAVFIGGGVGIQKDLNVGGFIYGRVSQASTSLQLLITATNVDATFYPTFSQTPYGVGYLYTDNVTGSVGDGGLTYNPFTGKLIAEKMSVTSTAASISTVTGALTAVGGVGIGGDVHIGGAGYVDQLYTKIIESTTGPIQINPEGKMTEIVGDIRVLGQKPIGTAPVVTNVLYVTMDGDDTNDGRAMDASRACRTITGAVNSPYYQPGTQIQVSPGFYLEDNPIQLKPYTSIMGSDIRTTSVEPINKTQDLFHMNSGCYLAFMQFLNGRSGLLEGVYDPRFNRGAYTTAFPPLEGDARIDLFHSPYVQNCTNLSGPWLKDGTLFTPNQTVQIPLAVGMGTWDANTTTIMVEVSTGTIAQGMYINPGQQNPGFFNARTLMLANKPFMQEQVVKFINDNFNSGLFEYDSVIYSRDIGLLVDSIATDLLHDSTSDSVFSGLRYWNQDIGYVDPTAQEITTATEGIVWARDLAISASGVVGGVVGDLFNLLLEVLNSEDSLAQVTDLTVSNTLPSDNIDVIAGYNSLLADKLEIITSTLDHMDNLPANAGFVYDREKFALDLSNIIDSVAFDALNGGTTVGSNKQTLKFASYFYEYNAASSAISNQIPQISAAYNFIKTLVDSVVRAQPPTNLYQLGEVQVTGLTPGTAYEVESLRTKLDLAIKIIRLGPTFATAKVPMNLNANDSVQVSNAYNLLVANRAFIQAEVLAYIDAQLNNFDFSREKSYRDAGILVENIAYDVAFGGNQKSVESGLSYYIGAVSYITGQENQCVSAIDYLSGLCQKVVTNTVCPDLYLPVLGDTTATNSPVINETLVGGGVAVPSVSKLFDIVTSVILSGTDAAPATYVGPGPDAAYVSAEILMHANRAFIQEDTINWINNAFKTFAYNEIRFKQNIRLILDSIALDSLYPTVEFSQSTFAGLQYWNQSGYIDAMDNQIVSFTSAMGYLKELSAKIVKNITTATDALVGITRYSEAVQITDLEPATDLEVATLNQNFDTMITILDGDSLDWNSRIVPNGVASELSSVYNAYDLMQANKDYFKDELIAFINATNPGFAGNYNETNYRRDIGYIVDSACFDLVHGGDRQIVQAALSYYELNGASTTIAGETTQTVAAFEYMGVIIQSIIRNIPVTPLQTVILQDTTSFDPSDLTTALEVSLAIDLINDIITNGPGVANPYTPISLVASSVEALNGFNILQANTEFIAAEVIQYINNTYNAGAYSYDQETFYRDTGIIVDAVSQDILLGGNQKSVEAGVAYWNPGYDFSVSEETTTTMALNHARDIILQIIANQHVIPQTDTVTTQVINPFFQYGGDYMPQQAVSRNFNIITTLIDRGPLYAPPVYAGGGLFALTGINGLDVKIATRVTSVTTVTTGTYLVGLDTPTIGFGNNSTLYFGDVLVFPKQDDEVNELSLELTGDPSTWNQRKVDAIGGMGGSLVDGSVISDRSPIQSFVYDAFTQLTQGGRGIHITNNGYAQLVSVFTIFSSVGVQTDNGGIASIVNSNANFGDICLLSKGYGTRKFSGTVYNPAFRAYPDSPGLEGLNQYYPNGFWPNNAQVEIFLSDLADRPHISLVMEVVPPDQYTNYEGVVGPYVNEQGFPGFLNATPSMAVLNTGTITITDIDTEGIAVGNALYIRDQDGYQTSELGAGPLYAMTGTVVTTVGYRSVTLNNALSSGGGDPTNANFFTLYFCGNAYYTVLSSDIADNPKPEGVNLLSAEGLEYVDINGNVISPPSQIAAHISALQYLNTLTNYVVSNNIANTGSYFQSTLTQYSSLLINDGVSAIPFIDLRFNIIQNIFNAVTVTDAKLVVPSGLISKTGTIPTGAGSAVTLIENNLDFLAAEVSAYIIAPVIDGGLGFTDYNDSKCRRDLKLILQRLIYDLRSGGNYNSVYTGLSYWSRTGTHHIVDLGENVRRTDLFPDGSTANFYQRSYISASGYVFEYVGAGTNYGSLPQVGRSDPVQGKETVQLDTGKVFFTSTDQNGDFRIGPGLVISQATGVLSGRTFTKSLFANMTPFILAVESGG